MDIIKTPYLPAQGLDLLAQGLDLLAQGFFFPAQGLPCSVVLSPGAVLVVGVSPIHNHGTWGVVAVISGQEKNTFWRRTDDPDFCDRIEQVGEKILFPGDIISFTSDGIHSVEAMGDEPTITFNIYG
ncbi:hypothetical protein [Moorena sp. SIO4A5]|uniref:cysteine dioxygenase family protein n=1 Tax=Moorena sp. SIO4A5 TaxID=2607838 RepID=UPI0025F60CEC|nr:hypothetical protein [Moorena sp. SIO4A5]